MREVLGHLIDSAANNHVRFVRAAIEDDMVFPGYAQNEWVEAQRYNDRDWDDLIDLWERYNRHIANVIRSIPPAAMKRERTRHNLDEIAWRTVPRGEPVTLEYFVDDYIAHLEHHLTQIRKIPR